MNHGNKINKLGRSSAHRKALLKSLASHLFRHGYIVTTVPKAKELRPFAEKLITKAIKSQKAKTLTERIAIYRQIEKLVPQKHIFQILVNVWGFLCFERPGGYLRIIKLSKTRKGDNAELAYIGIVMRGENTNYNPKHTSYEKLFNDSKAFLLKNYLPDKELTIAWYNFKWPLFKADSSFSKNKKHLNFKIEFPAIAGIEDSVWPVFRNKLVNLPLTLKIYYAFDKPQTDIFECNLSTMGKGKILAKFSETCFKILLPPLDQSEIIGGDISLYNGMSFNSTTNHLQYCYLIISDPVKEIFFFNLLK